MTPKIPKRSDKFSRKVIPLLLTGENPLKFESFGKINPEIWTFKRIDTSLLLSKNVEDLDDTKGFW